MTGLLKRFFITLADKVNNGDELQHKTAIEEIKSIYNGFHSYYDSPEIKEEHNGKSYSCIDQDFEHIFYLIHPKKKIDIDKLMGFISRLKHNFHKNYYQYWLDSGKSIYAKNDIEDNLSILSESTVAQLNPK